MTFQFPFNHTGENHTMAHYLWNSSFPLWVQVRTELKRKLRSWRIEAEITCCGQWLGMHESRVDTFSITTGPERNRSSGTMARPLPDGSPTPESSLVFRRQVQPTSPQPDDSLPHCPSSENRDNTLQLGDQDGIGQSSVAMQVSFIIHLQDPVEALPHAVNTDSDWIHSCIHCNCLRLFVVYCEYVKLWISHCYYVWYKNCEYVKGLFVHIVIF